MGLQVWLPLNGNLNNQGLSDVTVTNNGATVDSNGKIGSCYSFDGNDDFISLTSSSLYSTIKGGSLPFSITMWAYRADTTRAILFGDYTLSGSIDFNLEFTTSNKVRFYWRADPDLVFDNAVVATSKWSHIAVTYDGSVIKCYINGVLAQSSTVTLSSKNKTSGSYYLGRDARTGTTAFNGKMNDFRLYDHCLSAKEVKEISKGLSLHYPMNDPYIENTTNYSSPFTGSSGWNNSGSSVRSNDDTSVNRVSSTCPVLSIQQTEAGNSAMTFGDVSTSTYTALKGATVTASVYAYISDVNCSANTVYLRSTVNNNKEGDEICAFQYNGSTNPQNWPKNQWIRIEGTGTVASTETNVYFCTYTNNLNEKRYFTCWQLELKDHSTPFVVGSRSESLCFDSSGFGNNGAVRNQSSIFIEKDSPRYGVSTVFNGTPFIMGQNLDGAKSADALSLCAWINPSQVSEGNIISSYESGGAGLHILSGNIYFQIHSYGYTGVSGGSISANTWYYVVGTYDNSKLRIYINGELKGEVAKTGNITYNSNTPWSVAVNPSGTSDGGEHFYGKLSDVRIYSTALSASDIKELYNVSASIDKNGNMYAYEFKEE